MHPDLAALQQALCPRINPLDLKIENSPGKGRGLFSPADLAKDVLLETSPVLIFQADEYSQSIRHTILEHYVFSWRKATGEMALALGLGTVAFPLTD